MPTILTHAIVPMAIIVAVGRNNMSGRLALAGVVSSMVPDADVAGYWLGIPYAALGGHRGITHSLLFALVLGSIAAMLARPLRSRRQWAFAVVASCTLSHPLLDMLTNGGLGVALWAPWSNERIFFAIRPIEVASLRPARIFSGHGLAVLGSELRWVWFPAVVASLPCWTWRRIRAAHFRARQADGCANF
jgi:inner membrane protein